MNPLFIETYSLLFRFSIFRIAIRPTIGILVLGIRTLIRKTGNITIQVQYELLREKTLIYLRIG